MAAGEVVEGVRSEFSEERGEMEGDEPGDAGTGFEIADSGRVRALVDGMAREIHGALDGDLRVVGILRRGAPLARMLGRRLGELRGEELAIGELRLKRYADDLTLVHRDPRLQEEPLPFEVEGARVLLVDDVVYSGRTFLKAVCHLSRLGAGEIRLAALCSRGAAEVPVATRFVGLRLDVGPGRIVEVHAPPYEDEWAVTLLRRQDASEDATKDASEDAFEHASEDASTER